ncbi:unnamed protein product [Clavelina lepadiformis]|uniref:HP domain-containing protein n=1 Tax=Clavelina lepadiformis TaxID=159417 RepID=A0ABP0F6M5_CLALP
MIRAGSYSTSVKHLDGREDFSRNGLRSSQRSIRTPGKENVASQDLTDMQKSDKKTTTKMGGSNKSDKKSETKIEIASKAKNKFLDNLSRFQRETKSNNSKSSSFQRSYRKDPYPAEEAQQPMSNFRRSYRVPSTTRQPKGQSRSLRQSLRKERISDSIAKFERQSSQDALRSQRRETNRDELKSSLPPSGAGKIADGGSKTRTDIVESKTSFENLETTSPSDSFASSTPAGSPENSGDTSSIPSLQRKQSRAEMAVERHKERMRKASTSSPTSAFTSKPPMTVTKSRHRHGSTDPTLDVTSPTKLTEHRDEKPPSGSHRTKDDVPRTRSRKSPTISNKQDLPTVEPVPVTEGASLDVTTGTPKSPDLDENTFELVDIKSPAITRKSAAKHGYKRGRTAAATPVSNNHNSTTATATAGETGDSSSFSKKHHHSDDVRPAEIEGLFQPLSDIAEPERFVISNDFQTQKAGLKATSKADLVISLPPAVSKSSHTGLNEKDISLKQGQPSPPIQTVKENGLYDNVTRSTSQLPEELADGSIVTKRRSRRRKRAEANGADSDINYNADEAINTFRRLSEEIETIKNRGFRQSLADSSNRKSIIATTTPSSSQVESSLDTKGSPADVIPEIELPESMVISLASSKPVTGSSLSTGNTSQSREKSKGESAAPTQLAHIRNKEVEKFEPKQICTEKTKKSADTALNSPIEPVTVSIPESTKTAEPGVTGTTDFSQPFSSEIDYCPESLIITAHVPAATPVPKKTVEDSEGQHETKEMSVVAKPISTQNSGFSKFRRLSQAQRKERLRQAVLKYRADSSSSDNDSIFSDADSDGSDIDVAWLEDGASDTSSSSASKGKKTLPSSTSPSTKDRSHVRDDAIASSSKSNTNNNASTLHDTPKVGNMKAIWETKSEEKRKPVRSSSPPNDLIEIRGKVGETKAAWGSQTTPDSTPVKERRHTSFEEESRDEDAKSESNDADTPSVGSMRSLWENKKTKKLTGYDAKKDGAFDPQTMGRLHGAKALFRNLGKRNGNDFESPRRSNLELSSKSDTTSVSNVKDVFESKAHSPVVTPKRTPSKLPSKPETPVKTPTNGHGVDDAFESEDSLSDVPTISSTSSSDDEEPAPAEPQVNNMRAMWERKTSQRRQERPEVTRKVSLQDLIKGNVATVEPDLANVHEAEDVLDKQATDDEDEDESPPAVQDQDELPPAKVSVFKKPAKPSQKSAIQSKISARKKKRTQRSMTQPITGDDVTSAKERVREQTATQDNKENKNEEEEEKPLSFADRLTFFNQLVSKAPPSPARKSSGRSRNSLKRFQTQPVDRETLEEAQKQYQEKKEDLSQLKKSSSITELAEEDSEQQKDISSTTEIPTARPTRLSIDSYPAIRERISVGEVPEDETLKALSSENEKKVGKLSPVVTRKFSQDKSEIPPSPSSRRRSRSPDVRPLSSERRISDCSSVSLCSSEGSDMGKNRETEIKATGSIHDRLKRLNKNQEEGWKRRIKEERKTVKSSLGDRMMLLQENEEKWKKNKQSDPKEVRASAVSKAGISDRLNSIMSNSENWKNKTGQQNDASQFTVQAKIAKKDGQKMIPIVPSPSMRRRVLPVPVVEQPAVTIDDVKHDAPGLNKLSEVLKLSQKGLEPEVIKTTEESTTEIPDLVDEDFKNFFAISSEVEIEPLKLNGDANGHFDPEESESHEVLEWLDDEETHHNKRNAVLNDIGRLKASVKRNTTRNKRSTRNPVKALAARADIKQSYTEQRSNVTKLEQQRIASKFGHGANFTAAALAGLANKADFSKVSLRSTKKQPAFTAGDLQPWKDKMLLRVKGRRHVQTRLVEPVSKSLNSGDAFLLILPDKLFAWFGEFSNVIEKAKVQEIADYIIHKGDLGSKATSLTTINEEASSKVTAREFWNYLGGKSEYDPSGGTDEDELFEVNAEATIKTYKLEDSKLVPYKQSWGKLPTMGQLATTDTYVFDFGAEMYIWQGKEVSFENRQLAVKLSRALWDQGYDYTELGFCPFVSSHQSETNLKGSRPEWGLFARVNENLETALVQEKFEDWSNIHREIGDNEEVLKETSRGHIASEMKIKTNMQPDLTPCDIQVMRKEHAEPLPLVLEGHNIRKGHGHIYDDDGRGLLVVTSSVSVWHATDKAMEPLDDENKGVFHRGGTYVVRWRYVVSSTGRWSAEKSKTTGDLKSVPNGRERTAYFLWTGRDSTVNEKGASALMATEIDKEVGQQIIVSESKEPPAMRQCFNGGMIVMDGKKGSREGFYSWKLYSVRGTSEEEVALYQVPCTSASLRSRGSFVALSARTANIAVWHGCKSPANVRKIAEHAAEQLKEQKKPCLGFRLTCKSVNVSTCEEGKENDHIHEALGRIRRSKYLDLLDAKSKLESSNLPRAWNLLSSADKFVAQELHPLDDTFDEGEERLSCFPYVQEQLNDLDKPALVLVESCEGVYLWQGLPGEELKGSAKRQTDINRRLAMETTVNYCKEYRTACTPTLINEQHEPLEFINAFPSWKDPEAKIPFEEKRAKKPLPIKDALATFTRLTYTLEELRASPLPEGVDPNHLETYLSAKDFIDLFEISKEEFYGLPPWKQQNLRKEKELF